MTMLGDPPTEGWRLWAFIAGLVVVGLMLVVGDEVLARMLVADGASSVGTGLL
jgi:hypothetical protein